ncbi:hypothetical protein [Methylacidimicrobium sp. B4]|uniref:hypothetical protein n=1 Tax=Methylacidimicrobium sp. B4 TaxID=2796139 RepID=UPI001A8F433F|nr:hypothetical protein [Methylacidimicrobium sp. B4]QSR84642.1 hypothetical protein MacB4_10695 [Methylacidimicrobium sp. B4]
MLLLHSENRPESKDPAQRLKRFFDASGLVSKGRTRMQEIPYHDFEGILHALDRLEVDPQKSLLHFTGGNKLMAMAAFQWARRRGITSFYLERGNRLIWFTPDEGRINVCGKELDGSIADDLDPLELLRCQIEASELERRGELLQLNEEGRALSLEELSRRCKFGEDLRSLLSIEDRHEADKKAKQGDRLEYNTAAVLLKLGVHRVRRSLRLKVKSSFGVSTSKPHEEIDLLFTHGGRLWLVDCKDEQPVEGLVDKLERELKRRGIRTEEKELADRLSRIREELHMGQVKTLKLDLLAVQNAGGLLGQTICVRRSAMPEEVAAYAKQKRIEVVLSSQLVPGLKALLQPKSPAKPEDLQDLRKTLGQR